MYVYVVCGCFFVCVCVFYLLMCPHALQGCFSGGMFALTSVHAEPDQKSHFLEVGKELTKTCHESYARTCELCPAQDVDMCVVL